MTTKSVCAACACLLAGLTLLAGCGRSPQTSFYTLTPLVAEATVPASSGPSFAIAGVSLPELVDRPQLVLPDNGAKVHILESHRWAEPLKSALPRLLAENLTRLGSFGSVAAYPQHAANYADYRIFVDIRRFEVAGNTVVVDAVWDVRSPQVAKPLTGRVTLVEPIGSLEYEAVVAGYSRAIARLSTEIALSLRNSKVKE